MTATPMVASSSHNLQREWRQCCVKALGYEKVEYHEEEKKEDGGIIMLNLLEDDDDDNDYNDIDDSQQQQSSDTWMENANMINESLATIIGILERKKHVYLQPHQEEEASLLESTILSFVAATANQIETLRRGISSSNRDYIGHCTGIVSYLLATLKEEIANPFSSLQKQRARPAMTLWDAPLQCRLGTSRVISNNDPLNDEEEREQRFLPSTAALPALSINDFMDTYEKPNTFVKDDLDRPKSLFARKRIIEGSATTTTDEAKGEQQAAKPTTSQKKQNVMEEQRLPYQQDDSQVEEQYSSMLQREAVLLTATLQNDLDSVQQVEARMTEITALLGQFSNLVSEQQMEISTIHETTVKSQQNVEKGQDHLVDAAERTKKSRHLMATVVFCMGITLLFFNGIS